jgi:UDPglucose 6-dehydrogenase
MSCDKGFIKGQVGQVAVHGDSLRISIVGTGYVGLVTGLCLSDLGNNVICIDVVKEKVEAINRGESPIFEEGIDELLGRVLKSGRFEATTDISRISDTDITFICVGTPSNDDGSLDLTHLKAAADDVGRAIEGKTGHHLVVVKSTVMPTTTERLIVPIIEKSSGRKLSGDLGVAMNPEFLREGTAIDDFMNPDRIILGTTDERSTLMLRGLYRDFSCPFLEVDPSTAEMIKVSSNAFLATKISFINEIGVICKDMGIDVREVANGMGLDPRISPKFLKAGCGFGGSCFPKDVRGLRAESRSRSIEPFILDAVLKRNERQPEVLMDILESRMTIGGKNIAVLGLAFKPGTDDIRESRAIPLVRSLLERGANVLCFDPEAMENFQKAFPQVEFCENAEQCIERCEAVIIVTEWESFADPRMYGDKLVIDGRGLLETENYEGICW